MNAFFKNVKSTRRTDTTIKTTILTRLSESVKEIQLCCMEENLSGDSQDIKEAGNNLCTIIEAIFLHELKDSLARKVRRAIADVDELPEPNFWSPLLIISHRQIIDQIVNLAQITTEIGQCRAWIRVALNDCLFSSYLMIMRRDSAVLKPFYNPNAFLRDGEILDVAERLIAGVEDCKNFNLPCNSSLLNKWPASSLILAGVWSPSLRPYPVAAGVDVAGNLDATSSINSETCSLGSVLSLHSHSSGIGQMINEDEALKIILGKHSNDPNLSLSSNAQTDERTSEISDVEAKSSTDSECTNQLEISFGNSLNKRTGWSFDEKEVIQKTEKKNEQIEVNQTENSNPETSNKSMEHSYNALIESYNMLGGATIKTPVLSDLMLKLENINMEVSGANIDNIINVTSETPTILKHESLAFQVGKIAKEKGLDSQNYDCLGCKERLGVEHKSKTCAFTGEYFCDNCIAKELTTIPARIIHNWDFSTYNVSQKAYNYIQEVKDHPVIDFKVLNPFIYVASEEMAKLQILRTQLNLLRAYLYTCREPVIEQLQKQMYPQEYMYEHVHQYSIADLHEIHTGALSQKLQKVVTFGKDHVTNCWLCSQKGFLCEICKKPKTLFPFDVENVYRCISCNAVYHNSCLNANKPCPKCERRKKRET